MNNEVSLRITCDVCIIGAGSAGMGAAYALKNSGKTMVIVDKNSKLGGTAVNSWVNTWIESLNPPYFVDIFKDLSAKGKASGNLDLSWVPARFAKSGTSNGLYLDPDALAEKYSSDLMEKDGNCTFLANTSFVDITAMDGTTIKSVLVKDVASGVATEINAAFFVDSSGDGVLCRAANSQPFVDYFHGEDPRDRFGEEIAPLDADITSLNEPSLFFKIKNGVNDDKLLAPFNNVYFDSQTQNVICPDYIRIDGYPAIKDSSGNTYVNPMTGQGVSGNSVLDSADGGQGYEHAYAECVNQRQYEYWKYIKLLMNNNKPAGVWSASYMNYGHTGLYAPLLGIRESYRINCERMLTQNDLSQRIGSNNLGHQIACGSHNIDFHIYGNIKYEDVKQFNDNELQPSGIPYECLIPRKLTNVLVAGRSYGSSHIALAARRVNKDMAQLGWAAGHAIRLCFAENLTDTRSVTDNMEKLQSDEYTAFKSNVIVLETLMKPQ